MTDQIKITETCYEYLNEVVLKKPMYTAYRLDTGRGRWYYTKDKDGVHFYQSVTSFIKNSLPTSEFLIDWKLKVGKEEAHRILIESSCYGSMLHSLIANFIIQKQIELIGLKEKVKTYLSDNDLSVHMADSWTEDLIKDLLAFHQFVLDYEIVPLAIEITLISKKHRLAGTLDFPCIMNDKLYTDKTAPEKRKRVRACIDFKSSRKGNFYEPHELQLEACKLLWAENFPDEDGFDRIMNWSPKDWRKGKKPTYNLADQSESVNLEKLDLLLKIAEIEGRKKFDSVYVFGFKGTLELGKPMDENYSFKSLFEIVAEREEKKQ